MNHKIPGRLESKQQELISQQERFHVWHYGRQYFPSMFLALVLFCLATWCLNHQVAAQQESGSRLSNDSGRLVWNLELMVDDDWGWENVWSNFLWPSLQQKIEEDVIENQLPMGRGLDLKFRFQSEPEPEAESLEETFRGLFLGAVFPGSKAIFDLVSDVHLRLDIEFEEREE